MGFIRARGQNDVLTNFLPQREEERKWERQQQSSMHALLLCVLSPTGRPLLVIVHQLVPLQFSVQKKALEVINVSALSKVFSLLEGELNKIHGLHPHGPQVHQSQLESYQEMVILQALT